MSEHRTAADEAAADEPADAEVVDGELDDLDAEAVEDLDVDEDAEQVLGGTIGCPTQ